METVTYTEAEDYPDSRTESKDILYIPLTSTKRVKVTLETERERFEWRKFKGLRVTTAPQEEAQEYDIPLVASGYSRSIPRWEKIRSAYLEKAIQPVFEKSYYLGIITDIKSGFIWKLGAGLLLILLGWDKFLSSYFVIAGITVILGVVNEIRISQSLTRGLVKQVGEQIIFLFLIFALVHLCVLLDIQRGEAQTGMRNLLLAIFAVVNVMKIVATAKEFGVNIPPAIDKVIKLFK